MAALTVGDVIALYLKHARQDQGERTYEGRSRTLLLLDSCLGKMTLAEAKPFHLRLWADDQPGWKSDWTKKGAISTVQRCLNWAVRLGVIERNPFAGVANREGEPGRAMTDAEFRAAMRGSGPNFRRVLAFLRYTGCRPCEMAAMEPSHVDFEQSIVKLDKHKASRTQRKRRPRVIVLHPVAVKLLRWCLRYAVPDQTRLFVNSAGMPWKRYALACRMKRLRKKLKLPKDCKTYGLRHKFGTDAILNGVEIKTLSVLLGHTSTRTTERYVHVEGHIAHLSAAVDRVMRKRDAK